MWGKPFSHSFAIKTGFLVQDLDEFEKGKSRASSEGMMVVQRRYLTLRVTSQLAAAASREAVNGFNPEHGDFP